MRWAQASKTIQGCTCVYTPLLLLCIPCIGIQSLLAHLLLLVEFANPKFNCSPITHKAETELYRSTLGSTDMTCINKTFMQALTLKLFFLLSKLLYNNSGAGIQQLPIFNTELFINLVYNFF